MTMDLCIAIRTSCLLRNNEYMLCSGEVDEPLKVSTDGTCGNEKYIKCPEGQCCSKYGWCGTSEKHCSVLKGCQSEFGRCNSENISENDRCGKEHGGTYCPAGKCCSKYGWCGISDSIVIVPVVANPNLVNITVVKMFPWAPKLNVVKVTVNVKKANVVVDMDGVVQTTPTVVPDVKVNLVPVNKINEINLIKKKFIFNLLKIKSLLLQINIYNFF